MNFYFPTAKKVPKKISSSIFINLKLTPSYLKKSTKMRDTIVHKFFIDNLDIKS
jgi:hypothetical protein